LSPSLISIPRRAGKGPIVPLWEASLKARDTGCWDSSWAPGAQPCPAMEQHSIELSALGIGSQAQDPVSKGLLWVGSMEALSENGAEVSALG
jgi:hypothetical protein